VSRTPGALHSGTAHWDDDGAADPGGPGGGDQYNLVAKTFNDARDPNTGDIDPGKVLKSLDKIKEAYGVFFQGPDRWRMEGLKNLMRQAAIADEGAAAVKSLADAGVKQAQAIGDFNVAAVKAAGKASVESTAQTGKASVDAARQRLHKLNQNPLGVVAGVGLGGAGALGMAGMPVPGAISGSVGGLAYALKSMMTTDAGKRFMLAASSLTPGSKAMVDLFDRLASGAIRPGARAASADATAP
jgi:hypothetical protein